MEVYYSIQDDLVNDISLTRKTDKDIQFHFSNYNEYQQYFDTLNIAENVNSDELYDKYFSSESDGKTLDTYQIKHWVSNRSFGELIDMFKMSEIRIPEMQRSFVWDSLKSSRLIESIILGLPIPAMFLMETEDNQYELIDGVQRLTSLSNYVLGNPWDYVSGTGKKRNPAKLSSKVVDEIKNKTFQQLPVILQRRILRSTIPLIEFRQMEPENYESKFLIFERINSGSVTLTPMQIRRSLFHGSFLTELYKKVRESDLILKLFSTTKIKNDSDVEAILRIICFYNYYYKSEIKFEGSNIKAYLNQYCNDVREQSISNQLMDNIFLSLEFLIDTFSINKVFRNAKETQKGFALVGNINISIMESFIGSLVNLLENNHNFEDIDTEKLKKQYVEEMISLEQGAPEKNPFRYSTGKEETIKLRYEIFNSLVTESLY